MAYEEAKKIGAQVMLGDRPVARSPASHGCDVSCLFLAEDECDGEAHVGGFEFLGEVSSLLVPSRHWDQHSRQRRDHEALQRMGGPYSRHSNPQGHEWSLLQETDAITEAIRELSETFPSIGVQLIDERNLYMVQE